MLKHYLIGLLLLSSPITICAQDGSSFMSRCQDSSVCKFVIRTEENTGDRIMTLDNFTVKINGDQTKVYYMHYSDGIVSSLTFPYSILDRFIAFEELTTSRKCDTDTCKYSILFENGGNEFRIPIDILHVEMLSSFMLELEE